MKKITIYKDLDLMSMEEINGYIDGFEELKQYDDENYKYSEKDFNELCEYIREDCNVWWEVESDNLKQLMLDKNFKVEADLGLWNGRVKGQGKFTGFNAIKACLGDDSWSAVEIYETSRGTLKVDYHHHDGTNHFTIKEVTARGLRSTHYYAR